MKGTTKTDRTETKRFTQELLFRNQKGNKRQHNLGVEMSKGGSTESNVRSFEAFLTIYLSIIIRNI
jgi:pyrroloquinoline quinone (PQQ) biosynthesis protein C